MNSNQFQYMLEDAKLGLQRNKKSVIAAMTLLSIALMLIGMLLLTRAYLDEAITYVESQLAMKVYVEDGLVNDVASILKEQSYTNDVTIETGETMLQTIAFFFEGKEHMLESFTDGSMPDAVKFTVDDATYMEVIQQQLMQVEGIVNVVYPQQMAEVLQSIIQKVESYGIVAIVIFFALSFLVVYMTFHLAMYERQQELRIKLFLGMDPRIVRFQFLIEGTVIGVCSAIIAMSVSVLLYVTVFQRMQKAVPYLGVVTIEDIIIVCIVQCLSGVLLAISASYMSTKKVIANG